MCSMRCFLGVLAFLFRNCGKKSLRWRWRFGALRSILCFYCSFDKVTPECLCNANAYEYFGDSSLICEPRTHMRSISCDFRENSVKIVTWTILKVCRKSGAIVDLGPRMGPALTDRPGATNNRQKSPSFWLCTVHSKGRECSAFSFVYFRSENDPKWSILLDSRR